MAGVRTHIVTAVEVTPQSANDAPFLPALAATTAENFTLREVSADKGYLTKSNAEAVEQLGAVPFIPFKSTPWSRQRGPPGLACTTCSPTGAMTS